MHVEIGPIIFIMHAGMACAKWDDSYFWNKIQIKIKASKSFPNPAINENLLTAHRIYKVDQSSQRNRQQLCRCNIHFHFYVLFF